MEVMRRTAARRVRHGVVMIPPLLRAMVRRLRRRAGSRTASPASWSTTTPQGTLELRPAQSLALLSGTPVGRLTCRIEPGTSTAECTSDVPDDVVAAALALVVASVRADVRRVAWFVPVDDEAVESALAAAGFVCEAWAAPPVGDTRPHRQWALLT
jgi:hypothetical protein